MGSLTRIVCKLFTLILVVVIIVVALRTATLFPRTLDGPPCKPSDADFIKADDDVVKRFQQALRFETISKARHVYDAQELLKIQEFIKTAFPAIHNSPLVQLEVVANYSLLYTVQGSSSTKPFLLMAHLDVVPISEGNWDAPPFSGDIHDGFIYGRGTIDDKHMVFGILEALEFLLKKGHTPMRPFYLAFGHDEEVGGVEGAYSMAQLLQDRGVKIEFILDEGLTVMNGLIPGISRPVALVGSSEKGSLTIKLSVDVAGGHSSMPSPTSSIGILSQALVRLESTPHPSMFGTGPEKGTFEHLASEMTLPFRVLMSNLWLFGPLVSFSLSRKPSTNAIVRTTTAVTMFNAGIKENVIAPHAEAVVNHRIHPSQTVKEVLEYDRQVINDDRVKISVMSSFEPLPLSPYGDDHFGWLMIKTSILQVFGEQEQAVVAPSVMIGNTDTRHYTLLTSNIYRFSPTFMYPPDLARFHGLNERISVKNYEQAINFYYHLMLNADRDGLEAAHKHGEEL